MTILHMNFDDESEEEDDSLFASKTSTNQKKPIPHWARSNAIFPPEFFNLSVSFRAENELQIAICNQIYFHRNPSEIFGNSIDCSPSHLRTILHSMLPNVDLFDDGPRNSNKCLLV